MRCADADANADAEVDHLNSDAGSAAGKVLPGGNLNKTVRNAASKQVEWAVYIYSKQENRDVARIGAGGSRNGSMYCLQRPLARNGVRMDCGHMGGGW